jgi:hypothetical protein
LISKIILSKAKVNKAIHSRFESLRPVLINKNVIINVINNTPTENILSLNNNPQPVVQSATIIHFDVSSNGAITELIQTIHKTLNISDPITFQTHISYFFLAIAAMVAAISGRLVPAATIVAQIARSETPKICAI